MPYAITPKPQAPDAPHENGVPALFRVPTRPVFTTVLLAADVLSVLQMFGRPVWGVFSDAGAPVLIPDSIVAVDVRREWRISDYPVEQGGFQSFDKVQMPGDARVRMSVSGASSRPPILGAFTAAAGLLDPSSAGPNGRRTFLEQLDQVSKSLDLYTVVTPDATYPSVNIIHYDYRRETRTGASLLLVDLWLQEVRVTAQTQFTNTKTPEGAANAAGGQVQGKAPTPAQTASVLSRPNIENIGAAPAPAPPPASLIT